jgi:hypothetical protein
MRVQDAIEILEDEPLESSVIVAYWNKETIELHANVTITDEQWEELCEHGNHNMDWGSVSDDIIDHLEYIKENT